MSGTAPGSDPTEPECVEVLWVGGGTDGDPTVEALRAAGDRLAVRRVEPGGARERLAGPEVDCVVLDGPEAADLVAAVREADPALPVFVSGGTPPATATLAQGARYLPTGEWGADELSACLAGAAARFRTRKAREREARRTTNRYRALVDHFPDGGVFLFDEGLEYTLAGGTELSAVGLAAEDVEGRTAHDLFPEDVADELATYYRRTLAGEEHTFEQSYQGNHYRIKTIPVRDDGEVVAGMAVSQNVTDHVERKRELERQNERLDEFASAVSHDLRNPLNVLGASLELAEETGDPTHFERAGRAVDRMERLVDDLLTLARQGEDIADTQPVDLAGLVGDCWRTVSTGTGTLLVETEFVCRADHGRLRQLLENLLANSIDHGGESVTVTVGDLPDGFFVADDGPGIPDEEREQVFESGYSTTREGTGFGLSIVREVAEAHGWTVSVADSEAGGARFEITGVEPAE